MKFMLFVFVALIYVFNGQVVCQPDFSGFDFNEPVDYNTACGEPLDGEFPWLVYVYKISRELFNNRGQFKSTTKQFRCYGTIIDKYTVVLPGHCITNHDGVKLKSSELSVDVVKTTLKGSTTKEHLCRSVIIHPDYEIPILKNDIAILKLTEPIEFSSYIHPICLANDTSKFNAAQTGVVAIWKTLNYGKQFLSIVHLPVYSQIDCLSRDQQFYGTLLSTTNFCSGSKTEGTNLCTGSGMGLMLVEETTTKFIWYLKGMLSLSKINLDTQICDPEHLVYTDVFKFNNWILENKSNQ